MKQVEEYQNVTSELIFWQGYDASVKAELSSSAIKTDGKIFFIDPIPLAEDALLELVGDAKPAAVILTNANHERASELYRDKFSIPICASADAKGEYEADIWWGEGEKLFNCLQTISLPGAVPGETALYYRGKHEIMLMGDAIINMENYGFHLLPEKYCADSKQLVHSLKKLLDYSFSMMTFAHGTPLVRDARQKLEALLP